MCGLLGQELVELLGKELYEIGMFEDEAANKAAFEELQRNGYIRYDHLPVMKPNGVKTQVEFVSNVYREGHRLVAQCNVRDISLRSKMEQQVKQQAEAMADQHRRKDEFLAMLSHELRNPLAPLRSATHLLRLQDGGSENPIQQQAREVIERQVIQLTRLVSDLLEVSRVATGRIRLDLEKVDLRPIVQDTLETVAPLIESRRHVTALTLPAQPVWVLADASRLEEVVVNLLNNAAKYTDAGGRIEVSLEHREDQAVLRISDSGIGIAPELLPRIFDLFTQADRSLDRSQGGLGIGLNLVQRLVELHGGTVEAHSPGLGRGSEFVVRLATVPAPGIEAAATPARCEQRAAPGLRVLLVDDNVDSCNMLAKLLEISGHWVQAAHTGPAGLQAALAWRPDVVLLDIGLPEIDGYEVARRLRHDPVMTSTKLVALTGYGAASDLRLAREAGFDAHMLKPVHLVELERLLAAWVEPRSSKPA
jgi:signal transduction histidine kinase/ActR/RegA family two-component response regulator